MFSAHTRRSNSELKPNALHESDYNESAKTAPAGSAPTIPAAKVPPLDDRLRSPRLFTRRDSRLTRVRPPWVNHTNVIVSFNLHA